jgi:hypothetical protein
MVHKVWGQTAPPSGLGSIAVHFLALSIYVMSHHALPRVSFHLKTRQEYFFYDDESFGMLKTGFGGTWYSALFGTPFADFFKGKWAKMGYLANYCSVLPHFCLICRLFIKNDTDRVSWW